MYTGLGKLLVDLAITHRTDAVVLHELEDLRSRLLRCQLRIAGRSEVTFLDDAGQRSFAVADRQPGCRRVCAKTRRTTSRGSADAPFAAA